MSEVARDTALRWFDEVWNERRPEAVEALFAPSGIAYGLTQDGEIRGPLAFKQLQAQILGEFPDLQISIEDAIAEGDRVAVRFQCRGTRRGTCETTEVSGMSFVRVQDGQIIESWNEINLP